MTGGLVGGENVPAVVLDGDAGLSGPSWLEADAQLGAELGWEAGVAPGEHKASGRRPEADDTDHERGAVVVGLDEAPALAGLESEGTGAPGTEREQWVGLPPLSISVVKRSNASPGSQGTRSATRTRDRSGFMVGSDMGGEGGELLAPAPFGVREPSLQVDEGLLA